FDLRVLELVAASPNRFDVVLAATGARELLPQFADEGIDDLLFRLIDSAVKIIHQHFLRQGSAFAHAEKLEHFIFCSREPDALAIDKHRLLLKVYGELSKAKHCLRMTLRAPADRVKPRGELVFAEGLRHVLVRSSGERSDF